jgi:hypothetical protein
MRRSPHRAALRSRATESELPYDPSEAATGYAGVTGLVSTFALAAVVLVFLIAATAAKQPSPAKNADMSFATILFAVGFLGCLLAAFEFASLAGGPKNVALTNSMLVASIVAVCLIAVLAGFEALAKGFLLRTAPVFTLITVVTAGLSPIFVWFPLFDYERVARVRKERLSKDWIDHRYNGPATRIVETGFIRGGLEESNTHEPERKMIALVLEMTALGAVMAFVGWLFHHDYLLGHPHQGLYYWLGILGLAFIALMTITALLMAADPKRKLKPNGARLLNLAQVVYMAILIAALP